MPKLTGLDNLSITRYKKKNSRNNQTNSFESENTDRNYLLRDMIEMLEISGGSRKMLHGPSLRVFVLKIISRNANKDRSRLYEQLTSWKKVSLRESQKLVCFESVFYDAKANVVHLCLSHDQCYPFKVG